MASKFHKGKGKTFYEEGTINLGGRSFTSGGSYLGKSKEGQHGGIFYEHQGQVGTWDGSKRVPYRQTGEWTSNMGDKRRSMRFNWNGIEMSGIHYMGTMGWDIVRAREVKRRR